jgi:hypothetical protein
MSTAIQKRLKEVDRILCCYTYNVMEITFANRSLYSFVETDESYPGPLDAPNDPNRPELCLDGFRF